MAKKQNVTNTGPVWDGCLQGRHGKLLYGWALARHQPGARVVLELCLNGEPFGCVIADVYRPDVAALATAGGDACHGFVADIGHMQGPGSITARVANSGQFLPGTIDLDASDSVPRSVLTRVFGDGGLRLLGWAIDPADAARSVRVRAYLGAQCVAEALADQVHPALRTHEVGQHGFTLDLPLGLADGRQHQVRIVDESGTPLLGSPQTICCYPPTASALLPDAAPPLLNEVLREQANHLPRSVGWQHYPVWVQQFAGLSDAPEVALPQLALILYGAESDSAAYHTSSQSVQQQGRLPLQIWSTQAARAGKAKKAPTFAACLQQACDSDAQWLTCLRAGDTLPPHALLRALAATRAGQAMVVYGDSEALVNGQWQPWFKPAWNPEYALATDYPLELMVLRLDLIRQRIGQHGLPQNPVELGWAALEQVWPQGGQAIWHVPHVLYRFHTPLCQAEQQQRQVAASAALARLEPGSTLTPWPALSAPSSATAHERPPQTGTGSLSHYALRRLQRKLAAAPVSVSLIIPTRDQAQLLQHCIESILQYTEWPGLEILVLDNDSSETDSLRYLRKLRTQSKQGIRVLPAPGPFNFARINNLAVQQAKGEVIGLINNDIVALHEGWLPEMLSHLLQSGVGAVGAKLLWPNHMVQHGGVLLGVGNVAGHYGNLWRDEDEGDHGRNQVTLQVSAVTAACLLMKKSDYLALNGMDEQAFPVAFNDVDLCLRLRAQGKAIIWTPFAKLLHAESASRGKEDSPQKQARAQREIEQLRQRWAYPLLHDPFYHPGLNLDAHSHAFGGLALPPRNRAPRRAGLVFDESAS
jgi:GT2 family glycosyltransferase